MTYAPDYNKGYICIVYILASPNGQGSITYFNRKIKQQKEKTMCNIDADTKLCHKCKKKAVIVENKQYYCADCMLIKQGIYYGMDKRKFKRKR
jgi:hypothetical protein